MLFVCAAIAFPVPSGSAPIRRTLTDSLSPPYPVQYKLLAYNNSKQTIASATIFDKFGFTAQPNNYASFYDDSQQNWSICFSTAEDASEFGKYVALAKHAKGGTELVAQGQHCLPLPPLRVMLAAIRFAGGQFF